MASLRPPPDQRPGGLVTRRRLALVATALGVVASVFAAKQLQGLLADDEKTLGAPAVPRSLERAEARWVNRAATYLGWLADARVDPSGLVVGECRNELDARVGDPPGRRLDDLHEVISAACGKLREGARELARARRNADAELTGEALAASAEGTRLLRLARAAVRPHAVRLSVSRVHTRLSSVASRLVGHEVTVRCWPRAAWRDVVERGVVDVEFDGLAGVAGFEEQTIHLAPAVCRSLERVGSAVPRGRRFLEFAFAVGVLSHEATHLDYDGPETEAAVECHGMQRIADTARLLGLAGTDAVRLAAAYAAVIYPQNPPGYRSAECRDGGKLDLRPRRNAWP